MRLHHRHPIVHQAELEIRVAVSNAALKLTWLETIGILLLITSDYQRYALRVERHGDSSAPADVEASGPKADI